MVIDDLDTSYAVDGLEAYTGRSYRRCMIRLATPADAEGIARIYDPVVSGTAISFEVDPPGPGEMERRIRETLELTPWLVEASEDGVRGYAYASRHRDRAAYRWSADVAVYVRGDQRRRGIGRALYATLFALLRLQGFHGRTPASPCPTRRAWPSTRASDSGRWASIRRSGTSWAPGATSDGGSSSCARGAARPGLCAGFPSFAPIPHGSPSSLREQATDRSWAAKQLSAQRIWAGPL